MMYATELETCAEKLKFYDVNQHGWEQEPNGFKANAEHVLTHLDQDVIRKDFYDPEVVLSAIAPDSLQYSFRLMRWTRQPLHTLEYRDSTNEHIKESADRLRIPNLARVARMASAGNLASHLHNLGHNNERQSARATRKESMSRVAAMLITSAELQAEQYDFDPIEAFNTRLSFLRQRYGIP